MIDRAVLFLALFTAAAAGGINQSRGDVRGIWFSPRGGCEAAIVAQIDAAKSSIDYEMFSFTSKPIAAAMIRAHRRGVLVRIVVDDGQAKSQYSQAIVCSRAGIPTYLDDRHALAHNKTRIFDALLVMLGSFNDSSGAEKSNAETLIAEDSPELVRQCLANFEHHLSHSKKMGASNALLLTKKLPGAGRPAKDLERGQGGTVGRNGRAVAGLHGAGADGYAADHLWRNPAGRRLVYWRKRFAKVPSR